jgi:hypothetical protein
MLVASAATDKSGSSHGAERARKLFTVTRDEAVDEFLLLLAEQAALALEEVICGKRIDVKNKASILAEGVVLTVAARMCRSGRGLMTLLYAGQNGEAVDIRRPRIAKGARPQARAERLPVSNPPIFYNRELQRKP